MAATTLSSLASLLGTYVEPSGDFKASLNQVLARMYNMGTYRDLTVQYSLPVVDGCVTLPDDADAILHTMINGNPAPVRALWHDFRSVGANSTYPNSNRADLSWGLIDAGFTPTMVLLPASGVSTLYIDPSSVSTSSTAFSKADGSDITVTATDGIQVYNGALSGTTITFAVPVKTIMAIYFSGLRSAFDLRTTDNDANTTIATVGPNDGVTRYRRFRLNNATDGETTVHVLCKRAFKPLLNDNDISYVSNITALKHGLLGRLMEDNGDIERSEYHWNKCFLLLEEEAASTRGAATPRLNVDPYGVGQQGRIVNLY